MNFIPFISECVPKDKDANKKKIQAKNEDHKGSITQIDQETSFEEEFLNKEQAKGSDGFNFKSKQYEAYQRAANQRSKKSIEEFGNYPLRPAFSPGESTNDEEFDDRRGDSKVKTLTSVEWRKIIKNNDITNTSHLEMLQSLRYGIPDSLRPEIWDFLARIDELKAQHEPKFYEKLKNSASECDVQINKDIDRTFSDHFFFTDKKLEGQQHLFNILRAYSNYDKEVGYTQGMNYIVGAIMIILSSAKGISAEDNDLKEKMYKLEEETFWIFIHITFGKNFRIIYKKGFPKLIGLINKLDERLEEKHPEISQLIKDNGLETFLCFHQMFLSLLMINTPLVLSKRLIDLFLIEEENMLFKVLIRAITMCKEQILACDSPESLRSFFNTKMMETCYLKCRNKLYLLFPSPESTD